MLHLLSGRLVCVHHSQGHDPCQWFGHPTAVQLLMMLAPLSVCMCVLHLVFCNAVGSCQLAVEVVQLTTHVQV